MLEYASGSPCNSHSLSHQWPRHDQEHNARATHGFEKKRSLGVPLATIWADMGYSPEMITTMQDEFAKESATAAAAQAASFGVDVPTA